MGRLPTKKPFLRLLEKPVVSHTIGVFDRNSGVDAIYVIVAAADTDICHSVAIEPFHFQKVAATVVGGDTRQDSVFNGLCALPDDTDLVIVHDGVRPFVTDEMIFNCLEAAVDYGASVAAVPVKDTIKVTDDGGFIVDTPDRSRLWAVQTPQAFQTKLLLEAHRHARKQGIQATDDAALVELLGFKVKVVAGSYGNLKITTPEDLIVAEALSQEHGAKS